MFVESLEGRTLFSVSAINTQVRIDRLVVKSDLLKFRSDVASTTATLLGDIQTLKADGLKNDATITPLFATFRSDVKKMHAALYSDNLAEKQNVLNDQLVIVKELIQLAKDKVSNSGNVAADQSQLLADRVQLQTDEINGLNTRITTRQTYYTTLSNDLTNIVTAAESDPNTSPTLQVAISNFSTARSAALTTLTNDLTAIMNSRTTLAAELMSLES
jgi:hypothetical protein